MSTVLNGGREKYFCWARKYEIPSKDKYKVDAGQIQSQDAQIRYRDWDKSDIKGFRQLSRGCWLRRLWECQQPQRWRLLILMRMGTRVRKRNPLWEWSMLDLWSDPLWKCRSRKVKVEIVKTSEECHRWNQKSLVIWTSIYSKHVNQAYWSMTMQLWTNLVVKSSDIKCCLWPSIP